MQVNSLQLERTALLEKAYGIRVPAPEVVRVPYVGAAPAATDDFSFEDMGDKMAKKYGFPIFDSAADVEN